MDKIKLNLDSIATLLFCCDLKAFDEVPLTIEEWYQVEKILKMHGMKGPADLFWLSSDELLEMLNIPEFIVYKMEQRRKKLSFMLNLLHDLENKGINIMTKYDDHYPQLLVKSMKKRAPVYMYYKGDMSQYTAGISICGLNELEHKDGTYIKRIVDKVIEEKKYYVSNDGKGVDKAALQYALRNGCSVVIFVCKNMIEKMNKYKRYIKNGQLVILSAVDPNSVFDITHAIDRNSYVCGLSKYQIIISSKINNGATWFTALQNMHHHWVDPLVLDNQYMGNQRLLEMQATPLYIKDVLSTASFEMIYKNNQKNIEVNEVNIDQMSIFEFIGEPHV